MRLAEDTQVVLKQLFFVGHAADMTNTIEVLVHVQDPPGRNCAESTTRRVLYTTAYLGQEQRTTGSASDVSLPFVGTELVR